MSTRRLTGWLACVLTVAFVVAPGATAGKPTIERSDVDETAPDGFLTDVCGFDVTSHVDGHVIVRTFSGTGAGPVELRPLNLAVTASANGNTYRFRDVGADLVRIEPDGTAVLMIIGQVPFTFTGVLKIDLDTGETILEPQHSLEDRIAEACAALAA